MDKFELENPSPDVERSHNIERLVILSDGEAFTTCSNLLGERVTEDMLKRTALGRSLIGAGTPKQGYGVFVYKRGEHYVASKPCHLKDIRTSKGIIRGILDSFGGSYDGNTFVIDYNAAVNRPLRPQGKNTVIIPATWKWVPLKDNYPDSVNADNFINNAKDIDHFISDRTAKNNAQKIAVHYAGENTFSIDGSESFDKVTALKKIAEEYTVHASAAEAMLKIAEKEHKCEAWLMPPAQYKNVCDDIKIAEGELVPETELGSPPAMMEGMEAVEAGDPERQLELLQAVEPALSEMNDEEFGQMIEQVQNVGTFTAEDELSEPPEEKIVEEATGEEIPPEKKEIEEAAGTKEAAVKLAQPPAPPMPPAMQGAVPPMPQAPPQPPPMEAPSATDQAFQETLEDLQNQMGELQSMMEVLQMVQSRAQQIEAGEQGGVPMQGMPPEMAPEQGGMGPAMQGGMPPEQEGPTLPVMKTEMPSEQEIASQVNPTFLEQAGNFSDMGAFDAGAISSLSQTPSLKGIASQYGANLEDSVDDLGRTLLTLYMQEAELKEQLGEEAFVKLEEQLRNTFRGLGDLVLNMSHHTSVLEQPNA